MEASVDTDTPYVTCAIKVEPEISSPSEARQLHIAVVSYAEKPITIYGCETLLDPTACWRPDSPMICEDQRTGEEEWFDTCDYRRAHKWIYMYDRDFLYLTLEPGVPFVSIFPIRAPAKPGHYRISVNPTARFSWWCWGAKEEVLQENQQSQPMPVKLESANAVTFSIRG